jgi:hypothetical protein
MALGIGLSPMLADRSLAQWYEGPSPPTQAPPQKFNIAIKHSPRAYNQVNVTRKSAAGRRFTIYWTWSYPWEANRDVSELDNRFSTMTEVRRSMAELRTTGIFGEGVLARNCRNA